MYTQEFKNMKSDITKQSEENNYAPDSVVIKDTAQEPSFF